LNFNYNIINSLENKLNNSQFINNAPQQIIKDTQKKLKLAKNKLR